MRKFWGLRCNIVLFCGTLVGKPLRAQLFVFVFFLSQKIIYHKFFTLRHTWEGVQQTSWGKVNSYATGEITRFWHGQMV